MRLLKAAARGLASIVGGYGTYGRHGWAREGFDFNAESGRRIDSSIVYSLLRVVVTEMRKAPIVVRRPAADGRMVEVPNHPITRLLSKPVPWMTGTTTQDLMLTSELAQGNSYLYKHRSNARKLIALEYLPMGSCFPYTSPGSGQFIDRYDLSLVTGYKPVDPADILHLRWLTSDPYYPQLGLGPLEAVLPEISTDRRAGRYEFGLLDNGGRSPAIISPTTTSIDGRKIVLTAEQEDQVKGLFEEEITRDNVGRPLISPIPISVQKVGFSPAEMSLEVLRNVSEERICAAVGVPPLLAGLGTGLDSQNDRASSETAERMLLFNCTIPLMKHRADQLTEALVPELGQEGDVVAYAYETMPLYRRLMAEQDEREAGGPTLTVNEVRERQGLAPVPGGDQVRKLGPSGQRVAVVPDEA